VLGKEEPPKKEGDSEVATEADVEESVMRPKIVRDA
jgi:hypothetical protein